MAADRHASRLPDRFAGNPRRGRALASPPQRPVLFVNPRSGGGAAGRARLIERARALGIEAIELAADRRLDELVAAAIDDGADAVGAAGGDGSVATVAAVACARGVPFVCVPAGTRNHFARDLGVDPRDPGGALEAFVAGIERRVDVGDVNGRIFLNNVSLGVYGEAVRDAGYRDAKLRTLLGTTETVLGPGGDTGGLRVIDDLGVEHRGPVLVLASNNPYVPARPDTRGMRPVLDGGRLGIVVVDRAGPRTPPRAHAWTARTLDVRGDREIVHAGLDGEAVDLRMPLRIAIRPAALRVRTSAPGPQITQCA